MGLLRSCSDAKSVMLLAHNLPRTHFHNCLFALLAVREFCVVKITESGCDVECAVFCGLPTTYYTGGRTRYYIWSQPAKGPCRWHVKSSVLESILARESSSVSFGVGARDEIALEHFAQAPLPPNAVLDGKHCEPRQVREVLEGLRPV